MVNFTKGVNTFLAYQILLKGKEPSITERKGKILKPKNYESGDSTLKTHDKVVLGEA